jgi:hypothetical protein
MWATVTSFDGVRRTEKYELFMTALDKNIGICGGWEAGRGNVVTIAAYGTS